MFVSSSTVATVLLLAISSASEAKRSNFAANGYAAANIPAANIKGSFDMMMMNPIANLTGMTGMITYGVPNHPGLTVTNNYNPTPQNIAMDDFDCEDFLDDGLMCTDVMPGDNLNGFVCTMVYDDFIDFDCADDVVDSWDCDYDPFPPMIMNPNLPPMGTTNGGMGMPGTGTTGNNGGNPAGTASTNAASATASKQGNILNAGVRQAGSGAAVVGSLVAFVAIAVTGLLF
ncbi:hypothetical protein HDU76_005432 [Blyttiomyces sp. JEL0837]|nr:hypothetical protein HDU76_005432 [Blyttiomyces sp. JEL0837]